MGIHQGVLKLQCDKENVDGQNNYYRASADKVGQSPNYLISREPCCTSQDLSTGKVSLLHHA